MFARSLDGIFQGIWRAAIFYRAAADLDLIGIRMHLSERTPHRGFILVSFCSFPRIYSFPNVQLKDILVSILPFWFPISFLSSSKHPNYLFASLMSMGPNRVSGPPLSARRDSYPPADYVIGIICPLEIELTAMVGMLDIEHDRHSDIRSDGNHYQLGAINGFNTVIASLPAGLQGKVDASRVALRFKRTFPNVKLRLVVGIGGGIPVPNDIRLGDVVVSLPDGTSGGVVEYDLGRSTNEGFKRKGTQPTPGFEYLSAITEMQNKHSMHGYRTVMDYVDNMLQRWERLRDKYKRPLATTDRLFESDYHHVQMGSSCRLCDGSRLISRVQRNPWETKIHYGLIGSGDSVIKSTKERDRLGKIEGVLCVEMEAAGIMPEFPSIVIRGISDYADSHKNDCWQPFAAAVAAAVAKEYIECARNTVLGRPSPAKANTFTRRVSVTN
jgi:nucleoside phosphorylase